MALCHSWWRSQWILGVESSGRRGEAPVRFKVMCPRSGVRWWMWRGPHIFELALEGIGSDAVLRSFGMFGAAATLWRCVLHGGGLFSMVWCAILLTSTNVGS